MANISLEISTADMALPLHKVYPPSTLISDLRNKLELVVGFPPKVMKLYAGNQLIGNLENEPGKYLEDFIPAGSGSLRLVVEISDAEKKSLENVDQVPKFEITDDQYDARSNSVRKFLEEKRKTEGSEGGGGDVNATAAILDIPINSRCEIRVEGKPRRRGIVRFVGPTQFKPGTWVGVELDEPTGNNDGSVAGIAYFACKLKYGSFIRPKDVVCGDFPVEGDLELDEL